MPFEDLRAGAEAWREEGEALPRIVLLQVGTTPTVTARADHARDLLACVGLSPDDARCIDLLSAAAIVAATQPMALVVCAEDDDAAALVTRLRAALAAVDHESAPLLVWAGKPSADIAGDIDLAIHRGADAVTVMTQLHQRIGLTMAAEAFDDEDPDDEA